MNIPGVKLNLGGRDYIVPPLNFKSLKTIRPKLKELTAATGMIPDEGQLETVIDVVQLALQRNYPSITREELEDAVDLDNLKEIIQAIMGISGLLREVPSDEKTMAPAVSSAGATSTAC